MCVITDLDRDGVQEVLWGERCIELGQNCEISCADRDVYRGHSDVVQPVLDREGEHWYIYTCRESDPQASPRVVLFDDRGERVWGAVDEGHIDLGWVARLGPGDRPITLTEWCECGVLATPTTCPKRWFVTSIHSTGQTGGLLA